jgi:ABC-type nitrate/sulfonate/bicarbonate transport system substrate-binding protein
MHRSASFRRVVGTLAGAALILAACGSDDDAADEETPATAAVTANEADTTSNPPGSPPTAETTGSTNAAGTSPTDEAAGSTATATSPATDATPVEPLKVLVGSSSLGWGPFWIAEAEDLFTKHGVEIEVVSYSGGASSATMLTSGQTDLVLGTVSFGSPLAVQGFDVRFLYAMSDFDPRDMTVIGRNGLASMEDLAGQDGGCKIADTGGATALHGYALKLLDAYQLDCELVAQSDLASLGASVASGAVDAGVTIPSAASAAVDAGQVTMLIDPATLTDADVAELVPERFPSGSVFASGDAVDSKRESFVRFLAALEEAVGIITVSSPEELTDLTLTNAEAWGVVPPETITQSWELAKAGSLRLDNESREITEDQWVLALNEVSSWGLEQIDPNDPNLSYADRVDTSILQDATS